MSNGIIKYVSRLSLRFHAEDADRFIFRVESAKQRQKVAEDEIRFYNYVELLDSSKITDLNPTQKKNVVSKVIKRKRKEGEEDFNMNRLADLMSEVEHLFKLHLKKFNVITRAADL